MHTCLVSLVSTHHCSWLLIRLPSETTQDNFIYETLLVRWSTSVKLAWTILFVGFPYLSLFLQSLTRYPILLQIKHLSLNFLTIVLPFTTNLFWSFYCGDLLFVPQYLLLGHQKSWFSLLNNLLSLSILNFKSSLKWGLQVPSLYAYA